MSEPATLEPGTMLAHYRVESVLGAGGMGTVYLARDTALDRPVAVKVLRPEVAGDPDTLDRFVREARAAARVSHPNLTHVYFVGGVEDRPFFAMEHVPGRTLEERVRQDGPFDLASGIDTLTQAAKGLRAAHRAGVIHRDVKPSNLMVLPDGMVKVTDFGLSKSMHADVEETAGGRLMGTPTYMSPEQCRGRAVDERTDVYLLGLTGWFIFAGAPPYPGTVLAEVLDAQMNRALPDLPDREPSLPPGLDGLLAAMCAKDPAARPADMDAVLGRLAALRPRPVRMASVFARGAAFAADTVLFGTVFAALSFLFLVVLSGRGSVLAETLEALVLLAAAGAVFLLPEGLWQTSAGKALFHLRVVRADGTRPGWGALAARALLRLPAPVLLPLAPFGPERVGAWLFGLQGLALATGFVWVLFAQGRTLSDVVTGTRVAYDFEDEPPRR